MAPASAAPEADDAPAAIDAFDVVENISDLKCLTDSVLSLRFAGTTCTLDKKKITNGSFTAFSFLHNASTKSRLFRISLFDELLDPARPFEIHAEFMWAHVRAIHIDEGGPLKTNRPK